MRQVQSDFAHALLDHLRSRHPDGDELGVTVAGRSLTAAVFAAMEVWLRAPERSLPELARLSREALDRPRADVSSLLTELAIAGGESPPWCPSSSTPCSASPSWLWIVRSNPTIFRRPASGPAFSALEVVYLAIGVVSVALGWYFNVTFVLDYGPDQLFFNPIWGDGSWAQYLELMYDNPAAGSAGADFTVANVVLLPLITIVDGIRRGHRPALAVLRRHLVRQLHVRLGVLPASPSSGSAGWPVSGRRSGPGRRRCRRTPSRRVRC